MKRHESATYSPAVDRLYPLVDALGVPVSELLPDDPRKPVRKTAKKT